MIELLVAMPMLTIVLGGLTVVLVQMMHSNDRTQEQTTLQTEARATLATLDTDIRQAFVGDGSDPIVNATATSITFESPDRYPTLTNGASQSSFHLRNITYTLTNGVLQRQTTTSTNTFPTAPPWTWPAQNGPVLPVMGSITNTDVFTYYTAAGAQTTPPTALTFPIADPTGIRAVGVKLTAATPGTQSRSFTVTELIALRETDG